MRIYCLSSDPNYPCLVLAAKGCTIMLDCALNMKSLQYYLPQMLVPNQRFENMPNYRTPNGAQLDYIKEFNNRIFINSPLEFGVPQFNLINIEDLDAVLISNYNSMLALPYLTKLNGFRATIYCTEPVMQFGKMLMEELTHYVKNNQQLRPQTSDESANIELAKDESKFPLFRTLKHLSISLNKKETSPPKDAQSEPSSIVSSIRLKSNESDDSCSPPPAKQSKTLESSSDCLDLSMENSQRNKIKQNYIQLAQLFNIAEPNMKPINWRPLYNKEDIDLCMSKIKLVGFNERVDVFGSLIVQPKSSGYALGSCNWLIESDCDTITYLSRSSLLSTHSKLFNHVFLKQQIIDCLLLTGLNQAAPFEPEQMIQEFCKACILTIKNQGNVLVPVIPTGKIYDLIECLYRYLAEESLHNIPVYFLSSLANQSLAYSNIYAEWLNDAKQNLVYAAESPFQHGELVKNNLLKVYPAINTKFNDDFNTPCILFASHPSLRLGEACHFVELWKNSPTNTIIFTDPEFNYIDALAPYQPIYASFYYFPIDTSLNTNQVHKLIKDSKQISQLVVSSQYRASPNEPNPNNLCKIDPNRLGPNTTLNYYLPNDIIKLNLKRRYENCEIEADLASMIMPTKKNFLISKDLNDLNVNSNVAFATFNAQLVTKNNHHVLKAAPRTIPLTRRDRLNESNLRKYVYGKLNLNSFLNLLRQAGLNSFKVSEKENDEASNGLTMSSIDKDTLLVEGSANMRYLIEIDGANRISVDLNTNKVNVVCDNEEIRVKVKDSLLKCLKTL